MGSPQDHYTTRATNNVIGARCQQILLGYFGFIFGDNLSIFLHRLDLYNEDVTCFSISCLFI